MQKRGYFVISLDFELMWGMFDKVTIGSYGRNISGSHKAIPEILKLFVEYDVHATWATVGMLMYGNDTELQEALPEKGLQPNYADPCLSSYEYFYAKVQNKETDTNFHFAPLLVQQIIETPGQELASHTFSHFYCLEDGENNEQIFSADCEAMQKAAQQFDTNLTSIIFPRNQNTKEALQVCREFGIKTYRGTESHFFYQARPEAKQTKLVIRALRLIDHYLNLSGHHTYPLPESSNDLINLPASRFLRPYSQKLSQLETLRLRRIKNAMTHAAKNGEVFHLWWHPHNFGINRKENLKNLLEILGHYKKLEAEYSMQSKNMQELATLVDGHSSVNASAA